jgi:hypothetical protein
MLGIFGGQARLFYFQSEDQNVGAWVLFAGVGMGLGLKVKATREGANALLSAINFGSKPYLKARNYELALARKKVHGSTLDIVRTDEWFSMAELDWASGSVTSAGGGFGIGVGGLAAKAIKGNDILFMCEFASIDIGTFGFNFSDSRDGVWRVIDAWDA